MSKDKIYYIYEWFIVNTNEVIYIGKGKNNRYKDTRRNKYFNRICTKYNCDVRIIKNNLMEMEAFQEEVNLIKYYKDNYPEYRLTNMTDGGEGTSGYKWTEELKREQSERCKGRIKTEETKRKMSENHWDCSGKNNYYFKKGYLISGKNNPFYGKKHSNETKKKMSENHFDCSKGKHPKAIKIEIHLNNNLIKLFNTIIECAQWMVDNNFCNTISNAKKQINLSIKNNEPYKELTFIKNKKS